MEDQQVITGETESISKLIKVFKEFNIAKPYEELKHEIPKYFGESGENDFGEDMFTEVLNMIPDLGIYSKENATFYSKTLLFSKRPFLITPTDEEVERSILFSGHRFSPYLFELSKIDEMELFYNGEVLSKNKTKVSEEEFSKYNMLLSAIYYDGAVEEINDSLFVDKYNFTDVYTDSNFAFGDSLLFTPLDYTNMKYEVSVVTESQLKLKHFKISRIDNSICDSFLKSTSELSFEPSLENLIMNSYVDLIKNGVVLDSEYSSPFSSQIFKSLLDIGVEGEMYDNGILYFWKAGEEPFMPKNLGDIIDNTDFDDSMYDELEALLKENFIEIDVVILDSIYFSTYSRSEEYSFDLITNFISQYYGALDNSNGFVDELQRYLDENASILKDIFDEDIEYYKESNLFREILIELYHYSFTMAGISHYMSKIEGQSSLLELYNICCELQSDIMETVGLLNLAEEDEKKKFYNGEVSDTIKSLVKSVHIVEEELRNYLVNSAIKMSKKECDDVVITLDSFSVLGNIEYL